MNTLSNIHKGIIAVVGIAVLIFAITFFSTPSDSQNTQNDASMIASSTISTSTMMASGTQMQMTAQTSGTNKPTFTIIEETRVVPTLSVETVTLKLNETKTVGGVKITPKTIKDTRCPEGSNCADDGDARVMLGVATSKTTKNVSLIEQQAFYVDEVIKVTLVNVLPEAKKGKTLTEADYQFVITVESFQ